MKKVRLTIGAPLGLVVTIGLIFYFASVNHNRNTHNDSFISAADHIVDHTETKDLEQTVMITSDANYITFSDVHTLDAAADLILIGTPTQRFEERDHISTYFNDGTIQDFYTLTTIQVDKVIKSSEKFELDSSNYLTVLEPIGYLIPETLESKLTREHYIELEQDHRYIIFLQQNSEGTYAILNLNLGKFDLSSTNKLLNSASVEQEKYDEFKASVLHKYDL